MKHSLIHAFNAKLLETCTKFVRASTMPLFHEQLIDVTVTVQVFGGRKLNIDNEPNSYQNSICNFLFETLFNILRKHCAVFNLGCADSPPPVLSIGPLQTFVFAHFSY